MFSYLVRRCLYGALILLGVNLLTFFLFFTVNTPVGRSGTPEAITLWFVKSPWITETGELLWAAASRSSANSSPKATSSR